jgi:hypothetical protein
MKILSFFLLFGVILPSWIRIRIQQLKLMRIHADLDPEPWLRILIRDTVPFWAWLREPE